MKTLLQHYHGYLKFPLFIKWVPCQDGMACPQVTVGGDSLQISRVAANIFNKQSRTADRGWLGLGGANNPPP
jgi:hypothetical protein